MEKIESINKKVENIFSTKKSKTIIGTILLSGIGITLPRIFHVIAGSAAGTIFLPMHIAVLIAALTFGATSGMIVAGTSIICSYLLTGMPTLAKLPYMLIELVMYAILLNVFNKKFNSYISLILTMVIGRILYASMLLISTNIFELKAYGISVLEPFKNGMPGLIIQIILVPVIVKIINERLGLRND